MQAKCPRCSEMAELMSGYCPPCRKAYMHEWYERNREAMKARSRAYYHANRERERATRVRYRNAIKREAIDAYGGVCACCGEANIEFLALDHINGGGKQHRLNASGVGGQFYRWLRRQGWPQGELRVLCHNCNMSFGFYKYCPHQTLPSTIS